MPPARLRVIGQASRDPAEISSSTVETVPLVEFFIFD